MRELTDRRFLGLLEAAPDAMICVEGDGRIALVNAQAERLFGYHRDDLVGQPVEVLVPEIMRVSASGPPGRIRRGSPAPAYAGRWETRRAAP